jgi:peptidoglycan/xylan/chitin deacetylase (PgdA/CDA1 family)
LGYHRVADDDWDPLNLSLRPEWFAGHLRALRERGRPIALSRFAAGVTAATLPSRAVSVTFDDGYRNLLDVVLPLLERFEVPATLFVVSGSRGSEFWWDELTRIFRPERDLPPRVFLDSEDGESVLTTTGREARRQAAVTLARRMMQFPPEQLRQKLDALWEQAGGRPTEDPEHRCMNDEELRQVAAGGLVEIGSHTVSHPVLTSQTESEQRFEIENSRAELESAAGNSIKGFSYPNGSRDATTVALVRAAGYAYACSSDPDVVLPTTSVWDLPRCWLPAGTGERFSRWFARWVA